MTASGFTESVVEEAALGSLAGLGYTVLSGPTIAPGQLAAIRNALLPKLLSGEIRVKRPLR
jgi:hypothetical protein